MENKAEILNHLQLNNTAKAYRINETNFLAFDGLTPKNEVIEFQKADLVRLHIEIPGHPDSGTEIARCSDLGQQF